jgi:hypothetical protein
VGVPRLLLAFCLAATATLAGPGSAWARPEVAIQPIDGASGPAVRKVVVRAVRAHRMGVTTGVPKAAGTGQYYTWAREAGLRAFVSSEVENLGRRRRATFLVWSGHNGGIVGRWTVTARKEQLPTAVARGFWARLGPSLRKSRLPAEWRPVGPGPTQRIDAGLAQDEDVRGYHAGRRRTSLLLR